MSAKIPQNCTWVGGVSPSDPRAVQIEDAAAGLTTVEAVNKRIGALTIEIGLLRLHRTKLQRAGRGIELAGMRRDFESGMSRTAICRKHGKTLGQLIGYANRGGWKCGVRSAGRKATVSDERLPELRAAYENDPAMLKVIAGRFGIGRQALKYYATRHGWVRAVGFSHEPTVGLSQTADVVSP